MAKMLKIEAMKAPEYVELSSYEEIVKVIKDDLQGVPLARGCFCYMAEYGKMKNFPINRLATKLVNAMGYILQADDLVVGTILVFGVLNAEGEQDGEEHDVPDGVYELAISLVEM